MVLLLGLVRVDTLAAEPPQAWQFGSPGQSVSLRDLHVAADGSRYMVGSFNAPTLQIGGHTLTRRGAHDGFVAHVAADGSALRVFSIGAPQARVWLDGIGVAADGRHYVLGTFEGANLVSPPVDQDLGVTSFLAAYDTSGTLDWVRTFRSARDDVYAAALQVGEDGRLYFAVTFDTALEDPAIPAGRSETLLVASADPDGTIRWLHSEDRASDYEYGWNFIRSVGIAVDSQGAVYVSGRWEQGPRGHPIDVYSAVPFLMKLGPTGGSEWNLPLEPMFGTQWTSVMTMAIDSQDDLLIVAPGLPDYDYWLVKLDGAGQERWRRPLRHEGNRIFPGAVLAQADGSIFLMRSAEIPGPYDLPFRSLKVLTQFDTDGSPLWEKTWPHSEHYWGGYGLAANGDDLPFVFGMLQGRFHTPTLSSVGYADGFLLGPEALRVLMASGFEE